jgi:hypothetical protein
MLMAAHIADASGCSDDMADLKESHALHTTFRAYGAEALDRNEQLKWSFYVGKLIGVTSLQLAHTKCEQDGDISPNMVHDAMGPYFASADMKALIRELGDTTKCDIILIAAVTEELACKDN